ncbi:MraY family glycosyltransferase [Flavobacterium hydatis]|uniref:Undecaprenyl-phosphate alpha-N-acetylglucosaminyl 1-phosphate transferase n=1 Tax=Flavobacterium hydatis TaxID=991 RepID=A0ABX4C2Q5_FLAHY|nr:MraY family glycosyltransferase [Flavobacterium hydatis]OXA86342.1 undecaprenyl-phosphate alpha-N-acetylglucosaminyl 1-phosphate transferase [Flavobacterium hydatis]
MQILITYILNYYFLGAFIIVLFSFLASYKLFPILIRLSYEKKLSKIPEERSSHLYSTPTMGGVGIFFGFTLTFAFIGSILNKYLQIDTLLDLTASLLILFFIGIKDDLLVISPLKKLIAQFFAAGILILFSDIYITNFYGIFGIHELPYIVSIIFTFFAFVVVINAYNLIDGIDGLAGAIALIISIFFGFYFLINRQFTQVLISFSLIGPLLAFLKFNVSKTQKIFMGDTGSMVIGFIIMYQSINFLTINETLAIPFPLDNGPIFILAFLSLPLTDTLRVFIIRIKNGHSPFKADRNHIHHYFLDSGLTHIKATIIITSLSLIVILSAFLLQGVNINLALFLIIIISSIVYLPLTLKRRDN